jgi:Ca2+-binding EF-hand superfamily protein
MFALLDTDRDGKLSEEEIDKAPEILKALDENGDGYVDAREAHPKPPAPKEESDSTETTTESSSD